MSELSDLEITRLCAEAMGDIASELPDFPGELYLRQPNDELYDPLHDDAQAMALVKRIGITTMWSRRGWEASFAEDGAENLKSYAMHLDLNRAICLCVAQLQRSRK